MPKISLSHFEAAFLFSLFTSVVMGITSKKNQQDRLTYGAQCFAYFIVALFGIGWAMRLGHG